MTSSDGYIVDLVTKILPAMAGILGTLVAVWFGSRSALKDQMDTMRDEITGLKADLSQKTEEAERLRRDYTALLVQVAQMKNDGRPVAPVQSPPHTP